jgi:hypothetical protein
MPLRFAADMAEPKQMATAGDPGSCNPTRGGDIARLAQALEFAAAKHRDQRRMNGDIPYINHPIGVVHILCGTGGIEDTATLMAAVLHDTIEDTDTTQDELSTRFGSEVAGIVAEVTDDQSLSKVQRKRLQIEHASEISMQARIVKLGDKLHNLRDLFDNPPPNWTLERIQGYFCWAYHVVQAVGPANEALHRELDQLFGAELTFAGQTHPALPASKSGRGELLQRYLAEMG